MKKLISKLRGNQQKAQLDGPVLHKPVSERERKIVHKAVKRTAEEYRETLELLAKT